MLSFYLPFIKKIISIGKKVVLVIAVYAIVLALFSHFIKQDKPKLTSDPVKENRKEIYKIVNDPETNKTTQGKVSIAVFRMMMCGMVGEGCTNNPDDADKNFNKSAFGFISKMILLPYQNPPASGVMWALNGLQNAGFIPKTYAAQGIGFGSVQPFSKIWVAFRDVAYVALVLVIITVGFMIMFRMKLNPQTVIGIENALPKIVISLILITFSFAIAGFLIDLMYLSIAIIIAVLQPASVNLSTNPSGYNITQYNQRFIQAGPMEILGGIQKNDSWGFFTIFWFLPNALLDLIPLFGGTIRAIGSFLTVFWIAPTIANNSKPFTDWLAGIFRVDARVLLNIVGSAGADVGVNFKDWALSILEPGRALFITIIVLSSVGTILIPLVIGLIIFLTVILVFFRIFFMLLMTYGKILLSIIIAPIYLLFEAIPGQSAFSNWIKGLIAELITFPVVIAIFIMGSIIIDQSASGSYVQFPFLFGIDPRSFSYILGMLLLFMTPDLVKAVKQFIVPKPGLLDNLTQGLGIGAFFGGATAGVSGGLGELQKYAGIAYYIKPVQRLLTALPGGKQLFSFNQPHPGEPGH